MPKPLALFLSLLLLLPACAVDPPARGPLTPFPTPDPRRAAALDANEAFFRHQFQHNASAAQQTGPAFYLSIDDQDPDPDFLARFADLPKPVLPGSQFTPDGERLAFDIHFIRWIDNDTLEIQGGYYEGNLSAAGGNYRLHRGNGTWTITPIGTHWMS